MPTTITLPDELFAKLQKHAIPLVDTPLTVIERALTALAQGDEEPTAAEGSSVRSFNPAAPPSLTYTTPHLVRIGGKLLPGSKTYWNPLMFAVIAEAAERGVRSEDICDLLTVNYQKGKKEDAGFNYIPNAGISVQGQDANGAWRQVYRLASSLGISVQVEFGWQNTEKAAMPNTAGSFYIEGE
ncbi:T4SS efffector SepA family protein [Altererythrobacter fulvus]|uniref:T4SS efffector SepA family protein n=1 Tax=Caenibius fulvus TaxID=2126012 RepID=UPI00301622AD